MDESRQYYDFHEEWPTRNSKLAFDFLRYCLTHPDERFWQALGNWSGLSIFATSRDNEDEYGVDPRDLRSVFYWEDKDR